MVDAVRARMLDTALPYVAGRRLRGVGLTDEETAALARWTDPNDRRTAVVSVGEVPLVDEGELLVLMMPGSSTAPPLEGLAVISVLYAFRVPNGLADDTAPPTLDEAADWPYSRLGAGVWMDELVPSEPLGCMVIASKVR